MLRHAVHIAFVARCLVAALFVLVPERAWSLAGNPDPTFDGDGIIVEPSPFVDEGIHALAVQSDDKILFTFRSELRRLATDGSLDPTFDGDGIVNLPLGVGGTIHLVGGYIYLYSGQKVARYDMTGTLDTSYATSGILTFSSPVSAADVTFDSLGRPVGVGTVVDFIEDDMYFEVYRWGLDGNPDATFGTGGVVRTTLTGEKALESGTKVVVQPDDKIVALAESFWGYGGDVDPEDEEEAEDGDDDDVEGGGGFVKGGSALVLVRYDTSGNLDPSFSGNGKAIFGAQEGYSGGIALMRRADGKLAVVAQAVETVPGDHDLHALNFARFNSDGSPDTTYGGDGFVRSELGRFPPGSFAAFQPDGKVLTDTRLRNFCDPYSSPLPALLRFDTDGSLDRTFGDDGVAVLTTPGYTALVPFVVDSAGRAVVAGSANTLVCSGGVDSDAFVLRLLGDCARNGVVQPGESCDDGDAIDDNGCDNRCEIGECWSCTGTTPSVCTAEAAGTACDDDNVCTASDKCDGAGGCTDLTPTPLTSCQLGEQSSLSIVRGPTPAKDKIGWKWKETVVEGFGWSPGDPATAGTDYTLCVFDGAGALMRADIPPGGYCGGDRCWKTDTYRDTFRFKDKSLSNDGIEQLSVAIDPGRFQLKGKGVNLPDSPVLVDPVTIQLILDGVLEDACLESVYTGADISKSTLKGFKGKHKE
ncbi:MAG: hypothetical protein IT294_00360 [Deltaproteobacteria bacterium]|nr:hypothetical protein [Deltaproteobacteria bacterium]